MTEMTNHERQMETDRLNKERGLAQMAKRTRRNFLTDGPLAEHPLMGCTTQSEAERRQQIAQLGRPMFSDHHRQAGLGEKLPQTDKKRKPLPVKTGPANQDGIRDVYKGKTLVGVVQKKPKGEWWIAPWGFVRVGSEQMEFFETLMELREYIQQYIPVAR